MRKAAFFCNDANARYTVFGAGRWERINHLVDIHPAVVRVGFPDDRTRTLQIPNQDPLDGLTQYRTAIHAFDELF